MKKYVKIKISVKSSCHFNQYMKEFNQCANIDVQISRKLFNSKTS